MFDQPAPVSREQIDIKKNNNDITSEEGTERFTCPVCKHKPLATMWNWSAHLLLGRTLFNKCYFKRV